MSENLNFINADRLWRLDRAYKLFSLESKDDADMSWGEWQSITMPSKFGRIRRLQLFVDFSGVVEWGTASSFGIEIAFPVVSEVVVSSDASPQWAGMAVKHYAMAHVLTGDTADYVVKTGFLVECDVKNMTLQYRLNKLTYDASGAELAADLNMKNDSINLSIHVLGYRKG